MFYSDHLCCLNSFSTSSFDITTFSLRDISFANFAAAPAICLDLYSFFWDQ